MQALGQLEDGRLALLRVQSRKIDPLQRRGRDGCGAVLCPPRTSLGKAQTQGVMVPEQVTDGTLEQLRRHPATTREQNGLIAVLRLGRLVVEEPPLDRSERQISLYRTLVGTACVRR